MAQSDCRRTLSKLSALIGNTPLLEICFTWQGAPAPHLRQVRADEPDRQHQGPDGAAHPEAGVSRRKIGRRTRSSKRPAATPASPLRRSGAALGHPVTIYMPDWMSRERLDLDPQLRRTIVPVSREGRISRAHRTCGRARRTAKRCLSAAAVLQRVQCGCPPHGTGPEN